MEKINLSGIMRQYKGFGKGVLITTLTNDPLELIYAETESDVNLIEKAVKKIKQQELRSNSKKIYYGEASSVCFQVLYEIVLK